MATINKYMIRLWKNITIEPLMIVYYAGLNVMELMRTDLKLERFCRVTNHHPAEQCEHIHDEENRGILIEAQKLESIFVLWEFIVGDVVPVIMLLYLSTWSDRNGRRLVMLMPLVGCIAYSAIYLLTAIFTSWPPIFLLIASFLRSLSGSHMLFLMGAYAYMADLTSHGARTTRMAVLTALMSMGSPIGTMLGPLIFHAAESKWSKTAGYQCVFATALLFFIVTFIITFIVVKDRPMVTNIDEDQSGNCFQMGWRNVTGLWNSAFKKRPQNRRLYILLLVALMLLNICAIPQKLYLWSQIVLGWDIYDYSPYWSLRTLLAHSMILILTPLIRYTGIHDCLTAAGAVLLKAIKTIMMIMVSTPTGAWVLWAFIWIPDGLESLAIRSLLTKVCEPFEVGRMMALLAVTEAIWPILDILLYTVVYNSTIEYWPSAVYVMSSAFGILVLSLLLWLRLDMKRNNLDEDFKKAAAKYAQINNESADDQRKCEKGEDSKKLEEKCNDTQNISNLTQEISLKKNVSKCENENGDGSQNVPNLESKESPLVEDDSKNEYKTVDEKQNVLSQVTQEISTVETFLIENESKGGPEKEDITPNALSAESQDVSTVETSLIENESNGGPGKDVVTPNVLSAESQEVSTVEISLIENESKGAPEKGVLTPNALSAESQEVSTVETSLIENEIKGDPENDVVTPNALSAESQEISTVETSLIENESIGGSEKDVVTPNALSAESQEVLTEETSFIENESKGGPEKDVVTPNALISESQEISTLETSLKENETNGGPEKDVMTPNALSAESQEVLTVENSLVENESDSGPENDGVTPNALSPESQEVSTVETSLIENVSKGEPEKDVGTPNALSAESHEVSTVEISLIENESKGGSEKDVVTLNVLNVESQEVSTVETSLIENESKGGHENDVVTANALSAESPEVSMIENVQKVLSQE